MGCSSSSPDPGPARGFALMLALLLVAVVLGGSALALQRGIAHRSQLRGEEAEVLLGSGVASGLRLARAMVAGQGRAQACQVATSRQALGEVAVEVALRCEGPEPPRFRAEVTARQGKARRTGAGAFVVVPSAGCARTCDEDGGCGWGCAGAPYEVVELAPAVVDGGQRPESGPP